MLTPRLKAILQKINGCKTLLDVGCDHAYLCCEAVKTGRAKRAIASDIRKGPLEAAKRNIENARLSDKIATRLGGGLTTISPGEADTVVIAGMGGMMISEILSEREETVRSVEKFIFQPMNCIEDLRCFLIKNNFRIENETLVKEQRRIYTIMTVVCGEQKPYSKEIMYHTGNPFEFTDTPQELILEQLERFENKFSKIIEGIEKSASKEGLSEYKKLSEELIWLRSEILKS